MVDDVALFSQNMTLVHEAIYMACGGEGSKETQETMNALAEMLGQANRWGQEKARREAT